MADLNSSIDEIVQGNDTYITRDIVNVMEGHYMTDAWFSIKENHWDADPIVVKHITDEDGNDGHIVDVGEGDTVGIVQFLLTAEDTLLLYPLYQYTFDIQIKTTNGVDTHYTTPEYGTLVVHPTITVRDDL